MTRRAHRLARGVAVSVGVHEQEGSQPHPSGPTVAEVGALAEFGTESQPPRPWLRGALEREAEIRTDLRRASEAGLRGHDELAALRQVGERLADDVRDRMAGLEPLDPDTVEAKGDATILEQTRTLRDSIRARARRLVGTVR